jgi:hypothetical protein
MNKITPEILRLHKQVRDGIEEMTDMIRKARSKNPFNN